MQDILELQLLPLDEDQVDEAGDGSTLSVAEECGGGGASNLSLLICN